MNDNKCFVSKDDFETSAANTLRMLWNYQDFKYVTLVTVDNQQIRAHKVIISSFSPFFRNILRNPHDNHIYLKDIRLKELEMVIKFMYQGQCIVEQYQLENFLAAAKYLEVIQFIGEVNITFEDVIDDKTHQSEVASSYTDLDYFKLNMSPQRQGDTTLLSDDYNAVLNTNRDIDHLKQSKPKEMRYDCIQGERTFTQQDNLSVQRLYKGVRCDQCGKQFSKHSNMIKHRKSKHERVIYNCNQCENKYASNKSLTIHKKSKHEGVRYDCDKCGSSFMQKADMGKHKKSKHEGVRYECEQCDINFIRKSGLIRHNKSIHDGVRYECDHCEDKFTHKRAVEKHKKFKHEGVSYDCDQCGNKYAKNQSLTIHKQSKHEGNMYYCDKCDDSFMQKCHLTAHKESKHDAKRYTCPKCDYWFTDNSGLGVHMKFKHKS